MADELTAYLYRHPEFQGYTPPDGHVQLRCLHCRRWFWSVGPVLCGHRECKEEREFDLQRGKRLDFRHSDAVYHGYLPDFEY